MDFQKRYYLTKVDSSESSLISELCKITQMKKLRTTPYRPEGNGSCERLNRTLISMIGILPENLKVHWQQHNM